MCNYRMLLLFASKEKVPCYIKVVILIWSILGNTLKRFPLSHVLVVALKV